MSFNGPDYSHTMPMPLASAAPMVPRSPSGCAIFCIAIGATMIGQLHEWPGAERPGVSQAKTHSLQSTVHGLCPDVHAEYCTRVVTVH